MYYRATQSFKGKVVDLAEMFYRGKTLLILHVMIGSLPPKRPQIIVYGLVRKCVRFSSFSWTIFILGLALNYIEKVSVF